MAQPVLTDMKPRLEAAARDVADARDAYKLSLKVRDELVIAAADHGMSQRAIANAAGVSVSRVSALMFGPTNDEN